MSVKSWCFGWKEVREGKDVAVAVMLKAVAKTHVAVAITLKAVAKTPVMIAHTQRTVAGKHSATATKQIVVVKKQIVNAKSGWRAGGSRLWPY